MKQFILNFLANLENGYGVCGIVDRLGRIYPLGSDTKVLSTVYEIIARRAIISYVRQHGLLLYEPEKQNYYPDFTLAQNRGDRRKIAVDVKTTYKNDKDDHFSYTLGGYTSFLRNPTKNILFPYDEYHQHWIIGFVYRRLDQNDADAHVVYNTDDVANIPVPFTDVEVFVQEKWRIASDKAGSGNTTNIGSIRGTLVDFQEGNGLFKNEGEFLEYWRGYRRTAAERADSYNDIAAFRALREI